MLDQWKEHKISDPTVAANFNTYRFADHKEAVIAPRLHGERGDDEDRAGDAVEFVTGCIWKSINFGTARSALGYVFSLNAASETYETAPPFRSTAVRRLRSRRGGEADECAHPLRG